MGPAVVVDTLTSLRTLLLLSLLSLWSLAEGDGGVGNGLTRAKAATQCTAKDKEEQVSTGGNELQIEPSMSTSDSENELRSIAMLRLDQQARGCSVEHSLTDARN
jgi:hypothetical protein